jgi:prepilin-type N-terminal cleavage/methylation domain-containing protein
MIAHRKTEKESGFTIVELMIATTVLSVILLLATVILLSIGRLYQKGVAQSQVQDNARTILDGFAQQLQASGSKVGFYSHPDSSHPNQKIICIGADRYIYVTDGSQISDSPSPSLHQIKHVLWHDTLKNSTSCPATAPSLNVDNPTASDANSNNDGKELIGPRARLSNVNIQAVNGVYTITVAVSYGDYDLFDDYTSTKPHCRSGAGGQYCATSDLTTTVVQRITSE